MTLERQFPRLSDRIDRYLDLWDRYGTAVFVANDLPGDIGADDDGERPDLDVLVALGLLERQGEDRYRIRLSPAADVDEWHATAVDRAERLREAVQAAQRRRGTATTSDDARVRFEGDAYLPHTVGPDETVEDVAATLTGAEEANRVVLRCPADEADRTQRLADRLCAPTADTPGQRYEKVTTQVLGRDPDDLEYRLYLRAADEPD